MSLQPPASPDDLRSQAVSRLAAKRAFKVSIVSYVVIAIVLTVVWALSGAGYFWPGWVIGFGLIGIIFQGYNAYSHGVSEADIQAEMKRQP